MVLQGATQTFSLGTPAAAVTWSIAEGAAGGSIVNGQYTAPATPGIFHVIVTSATDASNTATAAVHVPPVLVALSPNPATVLAGTAFRFHAAVSDAVDQSVQWSLSPASGGGTIDANGLYLAPASPGQYSVVATSKSGAGSPGTASIDVVAGLPGGKDLVESQSPAAKVVPNLRMYAVWWGNPAAFPPDALASIESLLTALPGSRHLAVVNQYLRGAQANLTFLGSLHDPTHSPPSVNPSLEEVYGEVCNVIHQYGITPTPQDIYFVYPSTPVNTDISGGATCGRHYGGRCNGVDFFIAWVTTPAGSHGICGNPALALDCAGKSAGASLMTRTSLHELFETITNGLYPTWVDQSFQEIADKCGPYAVCLSFGEETFVVEPEYSNEQHACVAVR